MWFWLPLATLAARGVVIVAFRHVVLLCAAWLLIAGATLEMTLTDLVGPGAFQPTIAVVKAAELGLAALCVLRFGFTFDVFNPALAYVVMFIAGMAHGLHPDLSTTDSLRSLLGPVAPFAFAFSRVPRRWGEAVVRTTPWIPLASVAGGALLDVAGLRPVFVDSGSERLAILLYREGRSRWLFLLAGNFLVLVLSGARAARLCGGGEHRHAHLPPFARVSAALPGPATAARRVSAATGRDGGEPLPGGAAVQCAGEQRGQSERSRTAVAVLRARGRGLALVRLGRGGGQRDHSAG